MHPSSRGSPERSGKQAHGQKNTGHIDMQMSTIAQSLGRFALPVWLIGLSVITSSLMVGHWITLPHPETGDRLPASVPVVFSDESGTYTFHFLYGDCPCSRRVLRRVLDRDPISGANERIVLIGDDPEMESLAVSKGFSVDVVTPPQLKSIYGVESAPLLVMTDKAGNISYSGGYTSRKQGPDIQDDKIIRDVIAGRSVDELPLYGCAVSANLKAILDPLNLKTLK